MMNRGTMSFQVSSPPERTDDMSLYENIQKRRASGKPMRKKGAKGAPSDQDFVNAAKTAKKPRGMMSGGMVDKGYMNGGMVDKGMMSGGMVNNGYKNGGCVMSGRGGKYKGSM